MYARRKQKPKHNTKVSKPKKDEYEESKSNVGVENSVVLDTWNNIVAVVVSGDNDVGARDDDVADDFSRTVEFGVVRRRLAEAEGVEQTNGTC